MTTLTDLEICKKIAEIEVVTVNIKFEWDDNLRTALYYGTEFEDRKPEYNPLTDDALCFALMVKYKVDIEHFKCGTVSAYIEDKNHGEAIDTNPNKAILLAIIEANKEP